MVIDDRKKIRVNIVCFIIILKNYASKSGKKIRVNIVCFIIGYRDISLGKSLDKS